MTARRQVSGYLPLAEHIDAVFSPLLHPLEQARERIVGPLLKGVASASDLACGTGTAAIALARRGVETFAVESSPAICRLAREKARRAGVKLEVIRAGMQTFILPGTVNLVLCEGDSLNHVPERKDLHRVAKAASRALRPGGLFCFDVNHDKGFERYRAAQFWGERPNLVAAMHNGHAPQAQRARSDIDLFVRDGRLWRRFRERVVEVCWTRAEIRAALRGAGFASVRCWDAAPFFRGYPDFGSGCRSVFLARKPLRERVSVSPLGPIAEGLKRPPVRRHLCRGRPRGG